MGNGKRALCCGSSLAGILSAMVNRRLAFFGLLLAFTASTVPAFAQLIQWGGGPKVNAVIVGKLVDFQNIPIAGARIGLATWKRTVWQPLSKSSADGTFELRVRIQPGDYDLIAGFGPYEVASSLIGV